MQTVLRSTCRITFVLFSCAAVLAHGTRSSSVSGATLPQGCSLPTDLGRTIQIESSATAFSSAGAWFAAQKRWSCAIWAFEASLRLDGNSWDANYNLGLAESQIREYRKAEIHLRRALQLNADSLSALDQLAQTLSLQGRYKAAIFYWSQALAIKPHDPDIEIALATAYSQNGAPEKAIAPLRSVIERNPKSEQAHFELGTAYANQKQYRSAADEFERALELNAADNVARLSMIKSLVLIEQYREALEPAQGYVRDQRNDSEGHYLLGAVYRGLRDYKNAEAELRTAIALNGDNSDLQYNLGFVLFHTGRAKEASVHLQKAIDLDPKSDPPWLLLANALKTLHEDTRAQDVFETVRRRKQQRVNEDLISHEREQANKLLESGKAREAVEIYQHVIEAQQSDANTYYDLALALHKTGERERERFALEKALALNPKLAPALNQLAILDAAEGSIKRAKQELRAAIEQNPQFAEAQNNLGVICARDGDAADGERMFRLAIENDPSYTQAYINLALALAQQTRFAEAQLELRRLLKVDPQNVAASNALKIILKQNATVQENVDRHQ